ncbi:MAG: ribonuclease R [Helicobacteraceae bacterium]|jgi:ribonuclease R|nr:ribonuclease R [Helicobacteraceae bacterium]
MKELLLKLQAGAAQSSLDKGELRWLHELIKAKVVSDREFLKLSGDMVVGVYHQPKIVKKGKALTGYLQPLGVRGSDLIVLPSDAKNAKHGDLVVASVIGKRRGRAAAKIIYIAQESGIVQIAFIRTVNRRVEALDIHTALPIAINTKQKTLKELPEGAVVTLDKNGEVADILGELNDPKVDEAIVLTEHNRADHFDADLILEAKSFGSEVNRSIYPDRADLTNLPFITIDPIDAKDYDDAIYFDHKQNTLYVAIADVTSYVTELGAIDKEAKKRGFSVYLPHKSIPMLPRELSENLCSLKPNADRLAFTFKIELDENLKTKSYELFESVIHSKRRYHYDRIDELFEGKTPDAVDGEILEWLLPLKETVIGLRKNRLKKGFNFVNPEIKLTLDTNLKLVGVKKAVETISHQLIEECMLLANCAAAEYFNFGIFRTHEPPDERSLRELTSCLSELGINVRAQQDTHRLIERIQEQARELGLAEQADRLLIRSLKRAQYTYDNVGHFGLGFSKYTHFTSPIRRYSDLMLHRLLKSILQKNEKKKSYIVSSLQRLTPQISQQEIDTAQIEWQYADRVYARWASENIGRVMEGEVIESAYKNKEPIVIISDPSALGMRVYVINAKDIEKFSFIKVEIISSNIATAKICGKEVFSSARSR